jgi:hypothetical protein
MHEFGYTFPQVLALTSSQFSFLLGWVKWYYEKIAVAKP